MKISTDDETSLRAALSDLESCATSLDDAWAMQGRLTVAMLRNGVDLVSVEANPRTVSDLEFALNDMRGLADELPGEAAAAMSGALATISALVAELRSRTALPAAVTEQITSLREKLLQRRDAVDRATFRDPASEAPPLPHDPASLRSEAVALRQELHNAAYDTPMLSLLIDSPERIFRGELSQLIEELEVIHS